MKSKKSAHEFPHQVGLRLTEDDFRRLERLSARLALGTVARIALTTGLDLIERQPGVLLGESPKRR